MAYSYARRNEIARQMGFAGYRDRMRYQRSLVDWQNLKSLNPRERQQEVVTRHTQEEFKSGEISQDEVIDSIKDYAENFDLDSDTIHEVINEILYGE